jgi:hypothetical protein
MQIRAWLPTDKNDAIAQIFLANGTCTNQTQFRPRSPQTIPYSCKVRIIASSEAQVFMNIRKKIF